VEEEQRKKEEKLRAELEAARRKKKEQEEADSKKRQVEEAKVAEVRKSYGCPTAKHDWDETRKFLDVRCWVFLASAFAELVLSSWLNENMFLS
jgi:hypothetical protein